jgi:glutathione S-transferase
MQLFYHPVSSNCQKVLLALYENGTSFEPIIVDMFSPQGYREYRETINPIGKIPALRASSGRVIAESSIIIEYLQTHHAGPVELIPADPELARETRYWDRFIDFYVNDPMSKVMQDRIRPEGHADAFGVEQAKMRLRRSYSILEQAFADGRRWLNGETFSLADCAAAPSLYIGSLAQPLSDYPRLEAYRAALCDRPSWRRIEAEAQPARARITDVQQMRAALGWL